MARQAAADPEAWRALRPVAKPDMIEDQQLDPPFGTRRGVPVGNIHLVVESSGSSGRGRETHYLSRRDFDRMRRIFGRYLAGMGVGADDVVALTLPVGMAGGGIKLMTAAAEVGAKVLRLANLTARQKIETMVHYRTSLLLATPFYVDRLARAAEELGVSPRDLGVRRILVATQSVAVDWIEAAQERWGARLYEWYGTSAGVSAFTCRESMLTSTGQRGTLHWDPAFLFQEVVNPQAGDWVAAGERGELIGTPLQVEAEPLFRVRTGDDVRFVPPGGCPCGSNQPGIESGTVRRLDQMLKVKGVNLAPAAVEAILFEFGEVRDYRARIFQDADQREIARLIVLARSASSSLPDQIGERLRDAIGLSFQIAVVAGDPQWTHETRGEAEKTQRWVDERGVGTCE